MMRLAVLLLTGASAYSQQPTFQDPLLDRLVGSWILEGTIAGSQTTHDVAAEWVLQHQYLRIHEVSRDKDAKGRPAYEASVFIGWDQASDRYACVWLDTYGGISPVSVGNAKRGIPNQIPFTFAGKDSVFHTTFIYDPASESWQWRMDGEQNGSLKPFARVTLKKTK